jgi:type I restriction enzyme S subunit
VKYISEEFHAKLRKSALRAGDVVTVRTGKPGATAVVPSEWENANCSDLVITRTGSQINPDWLSYYINSAAAGYIDSQLVGAVQQHFNVGSAKNMTLHLPSLDEQQAIAEVLGALDAKIAANTKLAQTADEFIRSSYLSVTEDCTKTISVADVAMYVRETVDPAQVEPDVIYVGLEHIPRRLMWLTEEGVAQSVTSAKAKFNAGDILFGKLRPYFHKVVAAPRNGICSTDVLPVRPARTELNGFVLAALSSDEIVREATAGSEGTRMPRASWKDLAAVQVPWPGEAVATAFSEQVDAIRNSVEGLLDEKRTLAATRDVLLPQLMSGKLRVNDAADVVGSLV